MLGIFAAKSGHPLANAREAKHVLGALASREAADALNEIAGWLESVAANEGLRPAERLVLAFQLDDAAQTHARKLVRDYLVSPRRGRDQQIRLWQVGRDFWARLGAAYEHCLDSLTRKEKGANGIKSYRPLLVARLLRAFSAQLKWEQFRYGQIESVAWQKMGRAYLLAEQGGFSTRMLTLYSGAAGETSVEREYLKALVSQSSSMDGLLPLEIEIAERLVAHFVPQFALTAGIRPEIVYWVDADKPVPPTRLAMLPEVAPSLRFFSPGAALIQLEELIKHVEHGEVPAELNLGGQYSPRIVLPVARHLAMYWSPKPPMRSHNRHRVRALLTVVNGLGCIHARLSGRGEGSESAKEEWIVGDVSRGGIRARVPLGGSDWLRIGALLGFQPEGGDNWLVGVIRRLNRDAPAPGSVGIETLSKAAQPIRAELAGNLREALLLDPLHAGDMVRVILPAALFDSAAPLLFRVDGKPVRLEPVEQIESGADFDLGLYKVAPAD